MSKFSSSARFITLIRLYGIETTKNALYTFRVKRRVSDKNDT